jgi:hypothetical protein
MTSDSARNKANKRKGAGFEIDVVQFLRDRHLHAERLTKTGREDEGDAVVRVHGLAVVMEAKNEKSIDLSGYMREATLEARQWEARRIHEPQPADLVIGTAVIKRRNHSVSKSYVVMEADDFAALLLHLQGR